MTNEQLNKLMEIQYLKGRLDELYKGYVSGASTHDSRMVDYRISKYEKKLKELDEVAYYLYHVERLNVRIAKQKSKSKMKDLLEEVLTKIKDKTLIQKLQTQLEKY